MASGASVARPYSQAVFELANEQANVDAWSEALSALSAIVADEGFGVVLSDPRIEGDQISDLLIELAASSLPDGGDNFVRLLVRNDRVEAIADVARQFELHVAEANRLVNAEVISAQALDDDQKSRLSAALEARLGCSVSLEEKVDAALLGGAIVKAGDLVIDGSAVGRIRKLGVSLAR